MKDFIKKIIPHNVRIELHRLLRGIINLVRFPKPAKARINNFENYPVKIFSHSSKIIKNISPDLMELQNNKLKNLRLACSKLDGLILEPEDIFSFCSLLGRTSARRGYLDGLEMHEGKLIGAPGGGLCQLANLIFWMALHLDMQIIERHRHELDMFPDDGRTVPFGMGATVYYNYHDLRFRNIQHQPVLLRLSVEPPLLKGAVFSTAELPYKVEIIEKYDRFLKDDENVVWRENQINKIITFNNNKESTEIEIAHNLGKVCYPIEPERIEQLLKVE